MAEEHNENTNEELTDAEYAIFKGKYKQFMQYVQSFHQFVQDNSIVLETQDANAIKSTMRQAEELDKKMTEQKKRQEAKDQLKHASTAPN